MEKRSLLQTATHQLANKSEVNQGETGHFSTAEQRCTNQRIISGTQCARQPDSGNGLLWACRQHLLCMGPLPGRRGPVSFESLGLLSFLSNRGELQLRGPIILSPWPI